MSLPVLLTLQNRTVWQQETSLDQKYCSSTIPVKYSSSSLGTARYSGPKSGCNTEVRYMCSTEYLTIQSDVWDPGLVLAPFTCHSPIPCKLSLSHGYHESRVIK